MSSCRKLRALRAAALLALLPATATQAQEATPPSAPEAAAPPAAAPAAPEAISVPDIASRAEEARASLRSIEQAVALDAEGQRIADELDENRARMRERIADARRLLERKPALSLLSELALDWRATASDLARKRAVLTRNAQIVEDQLDLLTAMRERWDETRRRALAEGAPQPVIQAVDATLTAIRDTRRVVRDQRSKTLTVQNELAQAELEVAELLDPIDRETTRQVETLFEPDAPPLWALEIPGEPLRERLRSTLQRRSEALAEWAARERPRFLAQAGIFALVLALLVALRRSGVALEAEAGSATALVFARPFAGAAVVALCATLWLHPEMPSAARSLVGLVTFPVLWRLLPGLLGTGLRPVLVGLASLFVLGQLHGLAESLPVIERVLGTAQTFAAFAFGALALRVVQAGRAPVRSGWQRPLEHLLRVAIALLGASLLANAFGYVDLASLLTSGVLVPAYLGVALFAAVRIGDEVVAALLRAAALRSVRMAMTHAELLRTRGQTLLRVAAVGVWALAALDAFGLIETVLGGLRAALAAELEVGTLKLSLGDVVAFGVVIAAALALSSALRFLLEEDVYPRLRLERGIPNAVSTFLHYALLLFGFSLALGAAGLDLSRVSILAGAFGVGVGFGLQNVVNNFVSGLILLFERPVNVGDTVEIGQVTGEVRRIGVRSSTIRTAEGADVIVPNATLISDRVVNWTLVDRRRRIDITVGVAYGNDPERVLALLVDVGRKHKDVLSAPPPMALFNGFGESSMDFELRVWIDRLELSVDTRSELAVALYAALREAGIEIPYPHRDVTLKVAPAPPPEKT
jgi:small-conductance mechanosensitive channel